MPPLVEGQARHDAHGHELLEEQLAGVRHEHLHTSNTSQAHGDVVMRCNEMATYFNMFAQSINAPIKMCGVAMPRFQQARATWFCALASKASVHSLFHARINWLRSHAWLSQAPHSPNPIAWLLSTFGSRASSPLPPAPPHLHDVGLALVDLARELLLLEVGHLKGEGGRRGQARRYVGQVGVVVSIRCELCIAR